MNREASPDLRAPVLGLVAWAAALAAQRAPGWLLVAVVVLACLWLGWRRRTGRTVLTRLVWLVAASGVAASALLRAEAVRTSPVEALAQERALVQVEVVVTSDPVARSGRSGGYVLLRVRTVQVTGRGHRHESRVPLLVLAQDSRWLRVGLGSRVRASGRLQPAAGDDLAGVLSTRGPPDVQERPGVVQRGAGVVRASIRRSVDGRAPGPRALVPALVDGDDAGMPGELHEAFRTSGLTHLLAVSGTNLTLVVGGLLLLARAVGVRARGLVVVGALGVAGFVLLARAEPSVVRAAAMGTVGLLGLGQHTRRLGTRALGAAVFLLLLFDPALAVSVGFALSVLATAGILLLAPGWRDRLLRWLPRWAAEAIAIPLAAQIACTPLVAAISGQVSLVAVAANLLAAPAVGPATVLGLAGGVLGLGSEHLGRLVGTPAAWCAGWIIAVAVRGAGLPVAAVAWPAGPLGLGVLTVLCCGLALGLGLLLARRVTSVGLGVVMVLVLLVPLPTPGWPPRGWVLVACDVGQGDGLVLNAGARAAVVVDAGPDPRSIDSCLRRLGIVQVPLVLLTHFHADHVDGLAGVLADREVGVIEVTGLAEPPAGANLVGTLAARAGVPVQQAAYAETGRIGPLSWQVLAPSQPPSPASESPPNDASVVVLVETQGIRVLLMGDQETTSQAQLLRATGGLRADVLKVAHHGSARQEPALVGGLGARLALISVGADNDYGHPAPSLLAMLRQASMRIVRTDQAGDVAVTVRDGRLGVSTRGPRGAP